MRDQSTKDAEQTARDEITETSHAVRSRKTPEVVERVAQAIGTSIWGSEVVPVGAWAKAAYAAIKAMMEPTEAMRRAAIETNFITWVSPPSAYSLDVAKAFNVMLRKALEE